MGRITNINIRNGKVKVEFSHAKFFTWFPEEAICRLILLLPVGAVVQVSNGSDTLDLPDDVVCFISMLLLWFIQYLK